MDIDSDLPNPNRDFFMSTDIIIMYLYVYHLLLMQTTSVTGSPAACLQLLKLIDFYTISLTVLTILQDKKLSSYEVFKYRF